MKKITSILNYTPHSINILDGSKNIAKVIKSDGLARCLPYRLHEGDLLLGDVATPLYLSSFENVTGLPEEKEGTIIIVSKPVADALTKERDDLYVVDKPIRDNSGAVLGCRAFAKILRRE